MAFCWRADDSQFKWYLDPLSSHQKKNVSVGPPLTKLSGSLRQVNHIYKLDEGTIPGSVVMGSPGKGPRTITDQDRSALCKS